LRFVFIVIFSIVFFEVSVIFLKIILFVFDLRLLGNSAVLLGSRSLLLVLIFIFFVVFVFKLLEVFIVVFEIFFVIFFFIFILFVLFIEAFEVFIIKFFQIFFIEFVKILVFLNRLLGSRSCLLRLRLRLSLLSNDSSLLLGLVSSRSYLLLSLSRSLRLLRGLRSRLLSGLGRSIIRLLILSRTLGLNIQLIQIIFVDLVRLLVLSRSRLALLSVGLGSQSDISLRRLVVSDDVNFSVLRIE